MPRNKNEVVIKWVPADIIALRPSWTVKEENNQRSTEGRE